MRQEGRIFTYHRPTIEEDEQALYDDLSLSGVVSTGWALLLGLLVLVPVLALGIAALLQGGGMIDFY